MDADLATSEFDLLDDEGLDLLDNIEETRPQRTTVKTRKRTWQAELNGRFYKVTVQEVDHLPDALSWDDVGFSLQYAPSDYVPRNDCEIWLESYMDRAGGTALSADVMEAGKAAGFSRSAVSRAKTSLRIEHKHTGYQQPVRWYSL